jgi:hypothetical protein
MQADNMIQKVNRYQRNWKEHVFGMGDRKLPELAHL